MKQVLITGGASGIGLALARQYWQQGADIHLLDYDAQALAQCKTEFNRRLHCYQVDLLDPEQLNGFVQQFLARDIRLNLLINNAGITHRSPASITQPEVFRRIMNLNWYVPVQLAQSLLPLMTNGDSKIINMASMAALMPLPGRAAYCASKAALNQHFETWRPELKQRGIDLLMVFPSFVATNIDKHALNDSGGHARHPQSTIGQQITAEQMARLIIKADQLNRPRLLSLAMAPRFGYWLWLLLPAWFERFSWRKFARELT